MKKIIILFAFLLIMTLSSAALAEDIFTYQCDPAIEEGTRKTTTCWFYDSDGTKAVNPAMGFAGKKDIFEKILPKGDDLSLVSISYYGADGNPMLAPEGWSSMTIDYDLHQDGPVCRYWKTLNSDEDICGYTYRFYDTEEKPVLVKNGFGTVSKLGGYAVYSMSMFWKDDEFVQRESFYGTEDEPIILEDTGYAVREYIMKSDSSEEERYYDVNGALTETLDGYAYSISKPIAHKVKETQYFDAEGNLLPDSLFSSLQTALSERRVC